MFWNLCGRDVVNRVRWGTKQPYADFDKPWIICSSFFALPFGVCRALLVVRSVEYGRTLPRSLPSQNAAYIQMASPNGVWRRRPVPRLARRQLSRARIVHSLRRTRRPGDLCAHAFAKDTYPLASSAPCACLRKRCPFFFALSCGKSLGSAPCAVGRARIVYSLRRTRRRGDLCSGCFAKRGERGDGVCRALLGRSLPAQNPAFFVVVGIPLVPDQPTVRPNRPTGPTGLTAPSTRSGNRVRASVPQTFVFPCGADTGRPTETRTENKTDRTK